MGFSVRIKGSAARELAALPKVARTRIANAIDTLSERPYAGNRLKGDLRGLRRIRVGDYRVIYELQDEVLVVLVIRVAHRREAYR